MVSAADKLYVVLLLTCFPQTNNGIGSSPTNVPDGYVPDKTHPNDELVGLDVTVTRSNDPVPADPDGLMNHIFCPT